MTEALQSVNQIDWHTVGVINWKKSIHTQFLP